MRLEAYTPGGRAEMGWRKSVRACHPCQGKVQCRGPERGPRRLHRSILSGEHLDSHHHRGPLTAGGTTRALVQEEEFGLSLSISCPHHLAFLSLSEENEAWGRGTQAGREWSPEEMTGARHSGPCSGQNFLKESSCR